MPDATNADPLARLERWLTDHSGYHRVHDIGYQQGMYRVVLSKEAAGFRERQIFADEAPTLAAALTATLDQAENGADHVK